MSGSSKSRLCAGLAVFAFVVALTSGATAQQQTLKSLRVDLPQDSIEYTGAGADAVNGICLACHSAEMVLTQPKLSPAAWTGEVNKMRKVFKAPIQDADVAGIVDYLVKLQNR
jgi:mono/diheme cytochrome c family protein